MPLKRKITESSVAPRKVLFNSEESVSDEESVSTVNESEEDCEGSQTFNEVGATPRCATCTLSMKSQFLEDLKREKTDNSEDIFKKSFFEKLDRKGKVTTVDGGKDGLLHYRELDCYIQDFMSIQLRLLKELVISYSNNFMKKMSSNEE